MSKSTRLQKEREVVRVERHFKEKELHVERPGDPAVGNV